MTDVGKIEFNANPKSAAKVKESLIPEGWNKTVKSCTKAKISPLDKQVGGTHYKQYQIQPFEFFIRNQIPFHKADIIKRILRYDHPTGKGMEDLKKIKHEIDLIIQLENWKDVDNDSPAKEKTC